MKKLAVFVLGMLVAAGIAFAGPGGGDRRAGEVRSILLTDASGIDDASFNAAAWRGMLQFYGETWANTPSRGRLYQTATAATMAMYTPLLNSAMDERYDLIITTGFTWATATQEAARRSPNQNFLIIDVGGLPESNIMQALFAEHEGSFLVGAAAARQALAEGITNPRFGFIGGIAGAVITRFHVGFVQGVHSVIPGAEVLEFYVGSWGDPGTALIQARNWFNDGVFAIFSAAGASGNGTIAAAREMRMQGNNVWAIGVDSCQFELGFYQGRNSAVLTSMLKQVEAPVYRALNAVRDGTFAGGTYMFTLADDAVGFSTANPRLRADVVNQVNNTRQQIINGQIRVESTLSGSRARFPGFPVNLAIDG